MNARAILPLLIAALFTADGAEPPAEADASIPVNPDSSPASGADLPFGMRDFTTLRTQVDGLQERLAQATLTREQLQKATASLPVGKPAICQYSCMIEK